jgi:predicted ATPase
VLRELSVKGFKSLRDTRLELGNVNVLIGANGSGKSNVLEALGVLGAAAFRAVEPESLRYRGVRPGLPELYKSAFSAEKIRRLISIEAKTESASYLVGLNNPIHSKDPNWGITHEHLAADGRKLLTRAPRGARLHSPAAKAISFQPHPRETAVHLALQQPDAPASARALIDRLVDFAIYSPSTDVLRGLVNDVTRSPLGLSGSGLPRAVKDLLNRKTGTFGALDLAELWDMIEWAEDVAAVPADQTNVSPVVSTTPTILRFTDRYMSPSRHRLSAYDASEGALYVLFLLALISHPISPRFVAVDNFDQALHPRLASALTRVASELILDDVGRQIIFTTHNPLVLDGLDLLDDRIRLFAVERGPTGATLVRRVEISDDVLRGAEQGVSLSRLWVMGRLGAVPTSL